MLPKVLATWPFDLDLFAPIAGRCELIGNPEPRVWSEQELRERLSDVAGVICVLNTRITRSVLEASPKLRMVANVAVGYDNLDVTALRERGILASNTPDVLTDATADLTMSLILAVTRRIVEADRFTREGQFQGMRFDLLLGTELSGKTLGIIGYGRIGRAVAARAASFGMRIIYSRKSAAIGSRPADVLTASAQPTTPTETMPEQVPLEELLARSDIVSLHLPLNESTKHLLDVRRLALMRPSAYLINTSRGAIIDETALASALREGRLAGAGLDVYEFEPRIHPDLPSLSNVVLLPHLGSATREARRRMASLAIQNMADYLSGERPRNLLRELS